MSANEFTSFECITFEVQPILVANFPPRDLGKQQSKQSSKWH